MIFWVLILLLLLIACYFAFAPFYLEINTATGVLRIRFHKVASARLLIKDNTLTVLIKILWWQKELPILPGQRQVARKPKPRARKKKKTKPSLKKIWAVMKSFMVSKCYIAVDTGYMPDNGLLYPLFRWVAVKTGKTIFINFHDENTIILEVKNNAARMLWAYARA